jgi:hypothetical protein
MALFRKKPCTVPTWRGWLLLGAVCLAALAAAGMALYPFLAPRDEGGGAIFAVEGWMADSALRQFVAIPGVRNASAIFVLGGALDKGSELLGYRTFARVGAMTLVKLGLDPRRVYIVDSQEGLRARTLANMLALRGCLQQHALAGGELTLVSLGPHARRSRLLLARTLANGWRVRVHAIDDASYDPSQWWQSSEGFRTVIGEMLAYLHALIFVHPTRATPSGEPGAGAAAACAAVAS